MPAMMTYSEQPSGPFMADRSIVLASDSERMGSSLHRTLEENGFSVHYAGKYSQLDALLAGRDFDMVLLEVTGQHAVEAAVAAALRLKRANAGQFVAYLADAELESSGLAGDAVFPRNTTKLMEALRSYFAAEPKERQRSLQTEFRLEE